MKHKPFSGISRHAVRRLTCLLCLLTAAALVLTACGTSDGERYDAAVKLAEQGEWSKAAEAFSKISGYADSQEYIAYIAAVRAEESGDDEAAYTAYTALGAFLDSPAKAQEASDRICGRKYAEAMSCFAQGDYAGAKTLFTELDGYADSPAYLNYIAAAEAEAAGDHAAAAQAWSAAGSFLDSAAQAAAAQKAADAETAEAARKNTEEAYAAALDLLTDGKWREALAAFTALGDEEGAAYAEAMLLKENGDLEAAAEAFTEMGDYLDSAALAASLRASEKGSGGAAAPEETAYTAAAAALTADGWSADLRAAFDAYSALGDAQAEEVYALAEERLSLGDANGAYCMFDLLAGRSFRDSADRAWACRLAYAQQLYAAGDYSGAAEAAELLGDYPGAAELLTRSKTAAGE